MKPLLSYLSLILFLAACSSSVGPPGNSDGWLSDFSPAGSEVRLHFDPDTFPGDVEATLNASDPDAAVDPDAFEADTGTRPITHPALTRFSSVQVASEGEQLDFWIEVPLDAIEQAEQADRTVYAMIRLGGDLPGPYPEAMRKWHRALGPLTRSETGQVFLRLRLFVAAEELYALAVSGPRAKLITNVDLSGATRGPRSDSVFDVPWVIACWDAEDSGACDTDPGSTGLGRQALDEANAAAEWLGEEGFTRGRYMKLTHSQAVIYAEDEFDSLISDPPGPDDPVVHLAGLISDDPCDSGQNVAGCYSLSTGEIKYAFEAVGTSVGNGSGLCNIFVHEMTHGIQAALMPMAFVHRDPGGLRWHWLFEGTADATGYWSQLRDIDAMYLLRPRDRWRPWNVEHPLNDARDNYPYEAVEFFAALNSGSVAYLRSLFESVSGIGSPETSYQAAGQALGEVLGDQLRDYLLALTAQSQSLTLQEQLNQENPLGLAFLRLMTERAPSRGYPGCDEVVFLDGLPEDPEVSIDFQAVTAPFSSECWQLESIDHQTRFPGACLKFSLIPGDTAGNSPRLAFMLDGGLIHNRGGNLQLFAYAEESLWLQGGEGSIQVIDLDLERGKLAPPGNRLESLVEVQVDQTCGASEEDIARCLPTRVTCNDRYCTLQMTMGGPDDCWVSVGKCEPGEGCFHMQWGDWVPTGFGVCGATQSLMQHFQLPGESVTYEDSLLPAHGRCGPANFCRRIILCAE